MRIPDIRLTDRTREILIALTHRVRVLSLHQVARTWWTDTPSGITNARKALLTLRRAGYIEQTTLTAHPELPLAGPVFIWQQGDPPPDTESIAYSLQKRWTLPVKTITVFTATKLAANTLGGFGGRVKRSYQVTHDLHVALIYLLFLRGNRAAAADWISEELLERVPNQKLPDAVLRDETGRTYRVIEFGGAYDAKRVEKLHLYCARNELPYELW